MKSKTKLTVAAVTICSFLGGLYSSDHVSEEQVVRSGEINGSKDFQKKQVVLKKTNSLKCGWYHWSPYQYKDEKDALVGLDVKLTREIFKNAGYEVIYEEMDWGVHQEKMKKGEMDIGNGAFYTEDRSTYMYYSQPYRHESNALYVLKQDEKVLKKNDLLRHKSIEALIEAVKRNNFKLGVVDGYKFTNDFLNEFISNKENGPFVKKYRNVNEMVDSLLSGEEIHSIVGDRLVIAKIVWERDLYDKMIEQNIKLPTEPVHMVFSKKSVSHEVVKDFNDSLKAMKESGKIDKIIREYMFPVLISITVKRDWFYVIGFIGVLFFAIDSLLMAKDFEFDFFGSMVLAMVMSMGGVFIRDLLINRSMISFVKDPFYLYLILSVVIFGFPLLKAHSAFVTQNKSYKKVFSELRGLMLFSRKMVTSTASSAYMILGIGVAVEENMAPLWFWGPFLSCVTSFGGALFVYPLRMKSIDPSLVGDPSPELTIGWSFLFSSFLIWETDRLDPDEVFLAVILTIVGMALCFMLSDKLKLRSPRLKKE